MTKLLFDAPLNKKLTESEAVIAAFIVENIVSWLHEQKLPMPQALNAWHAEVLSKDSRWDFTLRFAGTLAHYTGIGDFALDMRMFSVLLLLFANAAAQYELSQVGSDEASVASLSTYIPPQRKIQPDELEADEATTTQGETNER